MRIAEAIQIGLLVAMRSMTLPAALSDTLSRDVVPEAVRRNEPFPFVLLRNKNVAYFLKLAAAGEIIGDKLPFTPNRTAPGPLFGRVSFAAGLAWTLAEPDERTKMAAIAAISAAVSSFALMTVRQQAAKTLHVPDIFVAVIEDALLVSGSIGVRGMLIGDRTVYPDTQPEYLEDERDLTPVR